MKTPLMMKYWTVLAVVFAAGLVPAACSRDAHPATPQATTQSGTQPTTTQTSSAPTTQAASAPATPMAVKAQQDELLALADGLSRHLRYGNLQPIGTFEALRDIADGHCGHYAFLFCLRAKLMGYDKFCVYEVENRALQANHTLAEVEVDGERWLYDPTSGIRYQDSLAELLKEPERAAHYDAHSYISENLRVYWGPKFFAGAKVTHRYGVDDPMLVAMMKEEDWTQLAALRGLGHEMALTANPSMMPRALLVPESFGSMDSVSFRDLLGTSAGVPMPVSLSWLDDTRVFVANYDQVYLLDLSVNSIQRVARPQGVPRWNPTGVYYHAPTKRLYVANYQGHDVLILNAAEPLLPKLMSRIADGALKGPENVAVSPDASHIAVADYDASGVFLYNAAGKLLWKMDVTMAHGVAFTGDGLHVLASGLGPKAGVSKFTLEGRLVKKIGQSGWGKNGFLWPTSISVRDGVLAVSDAHTGKITFLSEDLLPIATLGANGPGFGTFNMPYAVLWDQDNSILVADSFKDRLLRVTPTNATLRREYRLMPASDPLRSMRKLRIPTPVGLDTPLPPGSTILTLGPALGQSLVYKADLSTYWDPTSPSASLNLPLMPHLPRQWQASFSNLLAGDYYASMGSLTPALSASYAYFTYIRSYRLQGHLYTVVGSPQGMDVLVIRDGIAASLSLQKDLWCIGDHIVNAQHMVSLPRLVEVGAARIDRYLQRLSNGDHPLDALRTLLPGKYGNRQEFVDCFVTQAGKEFAQACMTATKPAQFHEAGEKYLAAVRNDQGLQFGEILLVHAMMAAGADLKGDAFAVAPAGADLINPPRATSLTWSADRPGLVNVAGESTVIQQPEMIEGFELERALDPDSDADYAAAREDQSLPQVVTLELAKDVKLRRAAITWESDQNCGSDYTIEAVDDAGKATPLCAVSGGKGRLQEVALAGDHPTRRVRLTLTKTIGQPRLLVRRIELWADNVAMATSDALNPLGEPIGYEVPTRQAELLATSVTFTASQRVQTYLDELSEIQIVTEKDHELGIVLQARQGDRLDHARLFAALCAFEGLPARVVKLHSEADLAAGISAASVDHFVVEVKMHGRWRAFDPTYGLYWVTNDKPTEILGLEDLAKLPPAQWQMKTSHNARAAGLLLDADRALTTPQFYQAAKQTVVTQAKTK